MADAPDERMARGMATAAKVFQPSPGGGPGFQYPPGIAGDWGSFSVSTVLGDVWSRPGLELKYRAVATISALTVLGRTEQLKAYINGGLNVGLTKEEICEVIFQMAVYGGFPAAITAFGIANEVFEARDAPSDS